MNRPKGATYSAEQKAEAVALARLTGAREAGRQLGIDWRSVRSWAMDAGADLGVPEDRLRALSDLALAKVEHDISSGRIRGQQLAVTYGILADKARQAERDRPPPPTPPTPVALLVDAVLAPIPAEHVDVAIAALIDHLELDHDPAPTDPDAFVTWCHAYLAGLDLATYQRPHRPHPTPPPLPPDVTDLLARARAFLEAPEP